MAAICTDMFQARSIGIIISQVAGRWQPIRSGFPESYNGWISRCMSWTQDVAE